MDGGRERAVLFLLPTASPFTTRLALSQVSNYYTQRLSGFRWRSRGPVWPTQRSGDDQTAPNWELLYQRARTVLMQFDYVFVTESFNDQLAMARGALAMGLADAAEEIGAHGIGHKQPRSYTRGASKRNASLTKSEWDTLQDWNQWDIKLFADAQRLASPANRSDSGEVLSMVGAAQGHSAPAPSVCASSIEEKWGEPISRLKGKVNCHRKMPRPRKEMFEAGAQPLSGTEIE